ncbi:MAG: hypothetical protein AAFU80_10280 [Pseudomonadota bacterium]
MTEDTHNGDTPTRRDARAARAEDRALAPFFAAARDAWSDSGAPAAADLSPDFSARLLADADALMPAPAPRDPVLDPPLDPVLEPVRDPVHAGDPAMVSRGRRSGAAVLDWLSSWGNLWPGAGPVGWPAAGGLAACAAVGLWIGFAPPSPVEPLIASGLGIATGGSVRLTAASATGIGSFGMGDLLAGFDLEFGDV